MLSGIFVSKCKGIEQYKPLYHVLWTHFPLLFRQRHIPHEFYPYQTLSQRKWRQYLERLKSSSCFPQNNQSRGHKIHILLLDFRRPVKWNTRMARLCRITAGWCDVYRVKTKHWKLACFCFHIWKISDLENQCPELTSVPRTSEKWNVTLKLLLK